MRVAEEMGLPGELWGMCVELGEMYQEQGDESQADQTFARPAGIIHALAGTLQDHQQRTTFLSTLLVQRVLEHVRYFE
ncbi:MAG TPA: hypothetical protein VFQ30_12195 [Ktedonobacteraceae bacterium]|nr:hypothetical protein [Ktedonobacteraceae bacterium]